MFTKEQIATARKVVDDKQDVLRRAEAREKRGMVVTRRRNGTAFLKLATKLVEQPVERRRPPVASVPRRLEILVNPKVFGEEPKSYIIPARARMTWFGGPNKELTVCWGDTVCLQFRVVVGGLRLICPSGYTESHRPVRHDTIGVRTRASAVTHL